MLEPFNTSSSSFIKVWASISSKGFFSPKPILKYPWSYVVMS